MSAFGFDPSIILQGRQATLADMLEPVRQFQGMQQSRQMHEATLADMVRRRDIEAMQYESLKTERDAHAHKSMQDALRQGAELMGRAFRGVKDQAGVDAALGVLRSAGVPEEHISMLPSVYNEQTAPQFEAWAQLGTPSARALSPAEEEARLARAEYEREKAAALKKGPRGKSVDPVTQEFRELRNKKLKRDLGEDGPVEPKESDVRSWSTQVPDGTRNIFNEVAKARAIADEVGGIEKLAGVGVFAGQVKPVLIPEKDRKFRQHAAAAANAYRKIFAGAAVSDQESAQINRAIAQVETGKTVDEVATGLMVLEGFADDGLQQGLAGASPEIKERIIRDIKPATGGAKLVKVRRKSDGAVKMLTADKAKAYLADSKFEEVK